MIYTIPVQYTNTIYKNYPFRNTGGNPQLQLKSDNGNISRILISKPYNVNFQYDIKALRLYSSYGNLKTDEFTVSMYPITAQWSGGVSLADNYIGSSWKNRTTHNQWLQLGGDYNVQVCTQNDINYKHLYDIFEFEIPRDFDTNNGFLIKHKLQDLDIGTIYYYSSNTSTPLYPRYVYYIDDYQYVINQDTNLILNIDDYIIDVQNIKPSYDRRQTIKFKLRFIPKIYTKQWSSSEAELSDPITLLDSTVKATYSIYDVTQIKHLQIIQHSEYTRINSNGNINYFTLDMSQFKANRKYKIELKINDKIIQIRDYFKVV